MPTAEKTCCGCGQDVSQAKRTKDAQGNYYCFSCQREIAKNAQAERVISGIATYVAAPQATSPQGKKTVTAQPSPMPQASKPQSRVPGVTSRQAPRAQDVSPELAKEDSTPFYFSAWFIITAGITVAIIFATAGLYFGVWRDQWERSHQEALLSMKADADQLVQQGKWEQANAKYLELFDLLGARQVRNPNLQKDLKDARVAADQTAAHVANSRNRAEAEAQQRQEQQRIAREQQRVAQEQQQAAARQAAEDARRWHPLVPQPTEGVSVTFDKFKDVTEVRTPAGGDKNWAVETNSGGESLRLCTRAIGAGSGIWVFHIC